MYSQNQLHTSTTNLTWSESSIVSSNGELVELDPLRDYCYIDEETTKTLELIQNNVDSSNRKHSLFGYLNTNTATTTGARLLQQAILKPLYNFEIIEHRLDIIDYLISRIDTLAALSNCIRRFGQGIELDTVVPNLINLSKTRATTIQVAERRLDTLATLVGILVNVGPLVAALELADQPTMNVYKTALQDPAFDEVLSIINDKIENNVRTSRGKRAKMFQIKRGVDPLFDLARNTYNVAIDDMEHYVKELQKEDGIPWKLMYGECRGFYLTVYPNQIPKGSTLNPRYIRVNRTRTLISCTTSDLMKSNVRANMSYDNSMKLANEIIITCLNEIISYVSSINKLVNVIGVLDLVTNFAKLVNSSNGKLVRPIFTATDTRVSNARHPVLEQILNVNDRAVVPNDIMLSTNEKNFMLITGPNMGGKSIYLKQVGILQVMAQLGCFVPAEAATVKLVRRIVARSGSSDDNESNCSSFMYEMKGIASGLKRDKELSIDEPTLYLIDEVGRGTSIDDGASYSFAIAEELLLRRHCFTIFATHFDQVFTLVKLYNNVAAYHFKYEEDIQEDYQQDGIKLKITHNLIVGYAETDHYGIKLAEACGLPSEILKIAKSDIDLEL